MGGELATNWLKGSARGGAALGRAGTVATASVSPRTFVANGVCLASVGVLQQECAAGM